MIKTSGMLRCLGAMLFLMLFTLWGTPANASHYAAADMYVDYVGSGPTNLKYKVTLILYKACEPGSIDLTTTTSVRIYSPGGCSNQQLTLPLNVSSRDTLDQLCANFAPVNACRSPGQNSPWPAFVRHIFVDTITLPTACTDWTFFWADGSRNGGIMNLDQPDFHNIYIEARINNVAKYNNSSPRFLIDPIPYLCQNQPASFLNGPMDPNNDSMRVINQQPLDGAAIFPPNPTVIPYATSYPFSLADPVISTAGNPYAVNVNTGTATFSPTLQGKFVLAFRCYEYDRYTGATLGYISRDVQVSVLNCNASPPTIDSIPKNVTGGSFTSTSSGGNIITICPGNTMTFTVAAQSQTVSNTIYLAANNAVTAPGSTFTVAGNGSALANGTFSWTPTGADVGDHTVIITAKDSTCNNNQPIVLKSYLVVLIKVLPGLDAGPDGHYCPPNGLPWQLNATGPPNITYTWTSLTGGPPVGLSATNIGNPVATPSVTTSYVVSTPVSGNLCKYKDTVTVTVHPPISVDAGPDQTICANDGVALQPAINPLTGTTTYVWRADPTLNDTTLLNPWAQPYVTRSYFITVKDDNGCYYRDSTRVIVNGVRPIINAFASRDTVCPQGTAQLFANIMQQPCGLAQSSCAGGVPVDKEVGTGTTTSSLPTPFYMSQYSGGERMQIIYRKDELLAAGVASGFINSIGFNIASKGSTDTFYNFTVKMTCTSEDVFTSSSFVNYAGLSTVFQPQPVVTIGGWNNLQFPVPYYWDGNSNLLVEICWGKVYSYNGGAADQVYVTPTSYSSMKYLSTYYPGGSVMGNGCTATSTVPTIGAARPNTRFNVCASTNYNYTWSPSVFLDDPNSPSPVIDGINYDLDYIVTIQSSSNPNCLGKDTVHMVIDNSNYIVASPAPNPVVLCRPGYLQFDAQGYGPKPLTNPACGTTNPTSCTNPDSAFVGSAVTSSTTYSPFYGSFRGVRHQYLIPASELRAGGLRPGTIRSLALSTAGIPPTLQYTNFKISLKCTNLSTLNAGMGFEAGTTLVYTAPAPFSPTAGWNAYVFDNPYNWDSTKNLIVDICYFNAGTGSSTSVNYSPTPGYVSTLRGYSSSNICGSTSGQTGPFGYSFRPNMKFNFCIAPEAEFAYTWDPGNFLSDSSIKDPIGYIPQSVRYIVSTQGRNGCKVRDTVDVYVPVHNFNVTPQDTIICIGESMQLNASNGYSYQWYENGFNTPTTLSCTNCANPLATPLAETYYTVVIGDEVNCNDTFTIRLRVKPLPVVNIITNDTTIKYGQSVHLAATGASIYYWSPASGLSNPIGVSTIATPTEPTTYVVSGLADNGCRNYDSVRINIDYRDNLFIPSAFSPNGDGKNDEFRIANFSFQKLQEFRVFNRWGQEIFSTNDGHKGWDGRWKGIPQDIGSYNYIIRVAFPDGYTETYKGDVTLIR